MASSHPEILKELIQMTNSAIKLANTDEKHFFTAYLMAKKTTEFLNENKYASSLIDKKTGADFSKIKSWIEHEDALETFNIKQNAAILKLDKEINKNQTTIDTAKQNIVDMANSVALHDIEVTDATEKAVNAIRISGEVEMATRGNPEEKSRKEVNNAKSDLKSASDKARSLAISTKVKIPHLNASVGRVENKQANLTRQKTHISGEAFKNLIIMGSSDQFKDDLNTFVNTEKISSLENQIREISAPPASCSGRSCFGRGGGITRRKRKNKGKKTRRNHNRR